MAGEPSPPDYELVDRIALTTPAQVKALSHPLRNTILGLLHERAATVTELAVAVERHLDRYFRAHDGGLPAPGVYDRVLREVERPLIARVHCRYRVGRHGRPTTYRCRCARPQLGRRGTGKGTAVQPLAREASLSSEASAGGIATA